MAEEKNSILLSDVSVEGDLVEKDSIVIDAKVTGDIKADDIKTHQNSNIKGNINSKNALINGAIEGDVEAELKATLGRGSHLEGNLQASIITIEEGARFDGMCHMIKKETKVKKIQTIHDAKFSSQNETA